jgi:serpin B
MYACLSPARDACGRRSPRRRRAWAFAALVAVATGACGSNEEPVECAGPSGGDPPGGDPPGGDPSGNDPGAASQALQPSPGVERSAPDPAAPASALAAGFNDAGFGLLRQQALGENLVFSPTSIGHALLMARGAADEATGARIDAAFSLPDGMTAHRAWNAIDHALADAASAEEEVTITLADRIWPRLDVMPDQGWVDLLASEHGASTRPLDFAGDGSGSRAIINDWVGEQTRGLIPELLPEGFIQPDTVLVLTDAIYFKARWQRVFGKYGPVTDAFTRLDGSSVDVEYLQELELSDPRGTGDGFVGADIPYVGGGLSLLLIVPDEGRFEEIRNRLDQDLID